MKRLDRYILRQMLVPGALALAVISFLAVSNEIRDRAQEFAAFVTVSDMLLLMVLLLPLLISIVVPMTFLIGLMLAFGRLAHQHELVAMQAAGVSLKRAAMPVIVAGAALSVACFVVQDRVQPWAVGKAFDLLYSELPSRVTVDRLQPGVMHEYEGWRVYYAARDGQTGALLDLDLVTPAQEGVASVYFHAERAHLFRNGEGYELNMSNGHVITEEHVRVQFDEQRLALPAPSDLRPRNARKMLPLSEVIENERALTRSWLEKQEPGLANSIQKERREISERLSLPFAALACAIAGAPLGVRAERRGRSSMFAAAIGLALAYAVLYIAVEPTGLRSLSEYIVRAWIPNLALIAAGMLLFLKADRIGA